MIELFPLMIVTLAVLLGIVVTLFFIKKNEREESATSRALQLINNLSRPAVLIRRLITGLPDKAGLEMDPLEPDYEDLLNNFYRRKKNFNKRVLTEETLSVNIELTTKAFYDLDDGKPHNLTHVTGKMLAAVNAANLTKFENEAVEDDSNSSQSKIGTAHVNPYSGSLTSRSYEEY